MALPDFVVCAVQKWRAFAKRICDNLGPRRSIAFILLCIPAALYVVNAIHPLKPPEVLHLVSRKGSRNTTHKPFLLPNTTINKISWTTGSYKLIPKVTEGLPALKVPGPNTLCPEFLQNAGFTERISFIQTSGRSCMTPRNLCGIESAARANPNMLVYVYMNNNQTFKDPPKYGPGQYGKTPSCEVTKILGMYPNVRVIHENLVDYLKDTEFWPLYEKGLFGKSAWSLIHLSDALRLAILTKFGGFYLDFDTITFRPLHCLRNSASFLEGYPHIENGILVFDKNHDFLKFLQRSMSKMYDPAARMTLGPPSVGNAFMTYCSRQRLETGNYACFNDTPVNLLHPDSFYPIRHTIWEHLYIPVIKAEDVQRMQNSYLAHIYSANWGFHVPETSLYASLARYYCPQVWNLTRFYKVKDGF